MAKSNHRSPAIVIIDPLGGHGGLHYYVDGMARGLVNAGVDVSVFVSAHTPISGCEPYRIRQTFGAVFSSKPKWIRGVTFVAGALNSLFRARLGGICVINYHFFHYEWMELLVVSIARVLGLRLVATIHDIESFGGRGDDFIRNRVISTAAAIIVHNEFSRQTLVAGADLAGRRVAVIPHGHYRHVFSDPPDRLDARARLGLDPDRFVFLFFGNSRPEKGLERLIRAVAESPLDTDWTLLVAGKMKPDQLAFYQGVVDECALGGRVRIDARHIPDEDAPSYYRSANLVVVPYHTIYESGVTIMAQTLGVPVLASDLPPLVEATDHGRCGLLFDSKDAPALSRALRAAIAAGGDELDRLGRLGQERALEVRSWDRIGRMTRDLIEQTLDDPTGER